MSTRTERLQASNLYRVTLVVLAVALGACAWVVFTGTSWPVAAVIAAVLLVTRFAIGAWYSRQS